MIKIILISMHNGILSVDCISEELIILYRGQ